MISQGDLFRPGLTGQQIKEYELRRHEANDSDWLARARARMVELLRDGQHEVSSDDVWRYCPPPIDCHPSVMGPVFRGGLFVKVGWRASTRPSAHARMISTYRLKE